MSENAEGPIETMAISKFKATCLAVIDRVKRTGRPVLITRFGEPMAQLVPPPPEPRPAEWLGAMKGRGRLVGDVVAPASEAEDWEVLRDGKTTNAKEEGP